MAKTISETFEFEGRTPEEMYSMFMDPEKMLEITGYETVISPEVGDKFSARNGAVQGQNLYIIPNSMIVQTWRWLTRKKVHTDSVLVMIFSEYEKGTKLEVSHVNLQEHEQLFMGNDTYWNPMKDYFKKIEEKAKEEELAKA
jgi:activator of HSP90 ATPase